jgi:hypothetical protein
MSKRLRFLLIALLTIITTHLLSAQLAFAAKADVDEALTEEEAPAASEDEPEENKEPPMIKVLKVKNNQAVVAFSKKRGALKVGQIGRLTVNSSDTKDAHEIEGISRHHFIALAMDLTSLSTKTDGSSADAAKSDHFNLSTVYGWNAERMEYGILLNYSFDKQKDADAKTLELGGVFDFNFSPNRVDRDFITGLRLIAAFGQQDNSAQTKAANSTRIEPGFFVKWFGLSPNLAAIGGLSYRMFNVTLDKAKTSTSGIVGSLGIQAYF